ncbi:TetR family transcriptional regulator [Longimycelium tulufanense]|uniref:TetR family transcriptional regulator n=1 Tax=Longimycelium tulufanense TaxID=907463 RepID=A0A8J3C6K4_9PSEU|nr:TetR/AcrR family transcriptional regulator [Longimycelium tulufanense]GGM41406.1 TetR family transcriptional regulator [Longimycelium tulufanense]
MEATWELVQQSPVSDVTIQAISKRSGVSKPTIYRWWPNRNAVVIDSVFARVADEMTFDETGSAVETLSDQFRRALSLLRSRPGRILAEILAEGQSDPTALASFNELFLQVRRAEARTLIERGIATGEFDPRLDVDVAIDMIYGPLYFRLLARHLPLTDAGDSILYWVLSGLRPRRDPPSS